MDARDVFDSVAENFEKYPLDFVLEADIQAHIFTRLRAELETSDELWARFCDSVGEPLGFEDDSIAKCKLNYKDHLQNRVKSEEWPLSRVHTEVNVTPPDEEENEQIDLAILNSELNHSVSWNDGSKRFDPSDLDVAIELKYIKNKNAFPKNNVKKKTLENRSPEELITDLDLEENKIKSDIEALNDIGQDKTGEVDSFMLIFSNYGYLYQGDEIEDVDSDMNDRDELLGKIGEAFNMWVNMTAEEHLQVMYVHPTGYEWLTD